MDHGYVYLFQVLFSFSPQPDATFRDFETSFSSTVSILLCTLDNSEFSRHGVALTFSHSKFRCHSEFLITCDYSIIRWDCDVYLVTCFLITPLNLFMNFVTCPAGFSSYCDSFFVFFFFLPGLLPKIRGDPDPSSHFPRSATDFLCCVFNVCKLGRT